MSQQTQQLWQQFRQYPRALQWAIIAAFGIVLFLIWNDYIFALGQDWKLKGDAIISQVHEVRDAERLEARFRSIRDSIRSLGPVEVPSEEKQAAAAFDAVVNSLISDKYASEISGENFSKTRGDRLRKGSLPGIIGAGERGEKIRGELEFESTPEVAMKIIADLESSPAIEEITEVRLSKSGNRNVKVKLQMESWIITRDTSRR